jgi:hypothetical protein
MTKIGRLRDGTSPVGLLPYLNAIDNVLPSFTPISRTRFVCLRLDWTAAKLPMATDS